MGVREERVLIDALRSELDKAHQRITELERELSAARSFHNVAVAQRDRNQRELNEASNRIAELEAALERIEGWARAYPLDVFPEPDLERAEKVLKEHGMGVTAISASAMRHVVVQVESICRHALGIVAGEGDE